ncbi:MAG: SGNH/GDSL hydrolase family protein [Clostridia bacterium]|nr:SGNH/GDSL hydrolase family protein [Clostridia bacterium]
MLDNREDKIQIQGEWLILGDSVSKGIVLNEENGRYEKTPESFISLLAARVGSTVRDLSMFGATVQKGLALLQRHKDKLPKNGLVLMEFGGNDCDFLWPQVSEDPEAEHLPNVPMENFLKLYRELIYKVKELGLTPVLLSLPPLDAERYFTTFSQKLNKDNVMNFLGGTTATIYRWQEAYSAALPGLALETGSYFLDIRQPFLLQRHPEDFICRDGIHPNEQGHRLIAKAVIERLSNLLAPEPEPEPA